MKTTGLFPTPALGSLLLTLACSSGMSGHPEAGTGGSAGSAQSGSGGQIAQLDANQDSASTSTSSDGSSSTTELPGSFVAVGYGARTIRSTDYGVSWTDDAQLEANGGDDKVALRTVIWGNQQFVAMGYRTLSSPDGKTWKDSGVYSMDQWIGAAVYAQGQYVAWGGYGLRATSADAVTWSVQMFGTTPTHAADGLVYLPDNGGRFAGANDDGQRSTSTDGKTWSVSSGATGTATTELAFGGGVMVSLGGTAVVVSRDGGATWSAGVTLGASCLGLVFAQGHFTTLAYGHVFTSTDGLVWSDHPVTNLTASAIAYGHGTYILVNGKSVARSTDGLTWGKPISLSGTNPFTWVAFGPTG